MGRSAYLTATIALAIVAISQTGCKKRGLLTGDSDEKGRLRKIAQNLDEAYAKMALPNVAEPAGLADRLDKWDDFRNCTVRTYVARRREADRRAREGIDRPSHHASIGDETIEECATQAAVINKDPVLCQRLELDYPDQSGGMSLAPVRCWDTRARVLGLPDECPVVWGPVDFPARNPECLALARRDQSICQFTESPGRCRALLTNDPGACNAPDAAENCVLASTYWKGLIPLPSIAPLLPPEKAGDAKLGLTVNLSLRKAGETAPPTGRLRATGQAAQSGLSWPTGRGRIAFTGNTQSYWGAEFPTQAADVGWKTGNPALRLAFVPRGDLRGSRRLEAPSGAAEATFVAVWNDPQDHRRCMPGAATKGEVQFDAGQGTPGSIVTGTLSGTGLTCSDGSTLDIDGSFRLLILDLR